MVHSRKRVKNVSSKYLKNIQNILNRDNIDSKNTQNIQIPHRKVRIGQILECPVHNTVAYYRTHSIFKLVLFNLLEVRLYGDSGNSILIII